MDKLKPISFAKLRLIGDGSNWGTSIQDEAGNELPVQAMRLEIDAETGTSSLWLRLTEPHLEIDLDLTPVEKRVYE